MCHLATRVIVALLTFAIGVLTFALWQVYYAPNLRNCVVDIPEEQTSESIEIPKVIPSDTLITLERTGCYGSCPSYTLTIAADGTLVFHATAYWARNSAGGYLKHSGIIHSSISQEKLRQLIAEFEKADYFSLRDSYEDEGCPSVATDSSSAYTSIQINGRRKAISHYHGCIYKDEQWTTYPRQLTELEQRIDEIVDTKQWMQ